MSRIKNNKEYSIRLKTFFGDWYYSHTNINYDNRYTKKTIIFTKKLSKVAKWKTLDIVEKQILSISINNNSPNNNILLSLDGMNLDNLDKNKIITIRKKLYYKISIVESDIHIKKAENNVNELNKIMIEDAENIVSLIKENKHIENDFNKFFKQFDKNIKLYRKDYLYLKNIKSKNIEGYLDIVNSSFNFRNLKIKNLNNIETSE